MGKSTSVYLTDALEARIKASGLGMAELLRIGCDAAEGAPEPVDPAALLEDFRASLRKEVRTAVREAAGGSL